MNAAQSFSDAFRPWINPRYSDAERLRNLTDILKSAAEQGVWLFQTLFLGPRSDMDQIAEAVRKIKAHAGRLAAG